MNGAEAVQPHLTTIDGKVMPLKSLSISGHISNNLASIELSQAYQNSENTNIEAIYTFPLPFDGVLMGMRANIGGRALQGSVMPKQQAEDRYEDAITDGDSAIMLEQQSPGLYTVNLGNLMAGEEAVIVIHYALPLKWIGRQLRIALPLTVAPRYGIPDFSEHKPFAIPEHDFLIEYPLTVSLSISAALAKLPVSSPTHQLVSESSGDSKLISLKGGVDHPDRDLVLVLQKAEHSMHTLSTICHEGHVFGHAAFCLPEATHQGALATKLLIDCSGSMAGGSMATAKKAIERLLEQSTAGDQLSLTAFGSRHEHFSEGGFLTFTDCGLPDSAVRWLRHLDANLGGTEMESALRAAFSLSGSEMPTNVLMITDGEIWNIEGVIATSRSAGQRVFIIGVGLSPAESNLRLLAEATGGAVEFLSPAEHVAMAVDRQLNRMRQQALGRAQLKLASELQWVVPNPETTPLYAGDTVHFWFETKGSPEIDRLGLWIGSGRDLQRLVACKEEVDSPVELVRLAIAAHLKSWNLRDMDIEQKAHYTELAVAYQLVTALTNFLMVHERGESAANQLPEGRQVLHMDRPTVLRFSISDDLADAPLCEAKTVYQDIPAFLRREANSDSDYVRNLPIQTALEFNDHVDRINSHFDSRSSLPLQLWGGDGLADLELGESLTSALEELIDSGIPEESVLLAFWDTVRKTLLKRKLKRRVIWWIKRQRKLSPAEANLSVAMAGALKTSDKFNLVWQLPEAGEHLLASWH